MATMELSQQGRTQAVASIQKYFEEDLPEPTGELGAGLLLNFFLEEVGPAIYNRAVSDAQDRLQQRVGDLSGELFADEFQYRARQAKRKARKQG